MFSLLEEIENREAEIISESVRKKQLDSEITAVRYV